MLDHAVVQTGLLPHRLFSRMFLDTHHLLLECTFSLLDRAFQTASTRWTRSDIRWTASAVIRLDMRWDLASPLIMVHKAQKPPSKRCHSLQRVAQVSTARYHVFYTCIDVYCPISPLA